MTSIPQTNLTEDYQQKLQYIQEVTQQDSQASLLAAIDAYYRQLKQTEDLPVKLKPSNLIGMAAINDHDYQLKQTADPLARLKKSSLIGSFQGDSDLSEQSEEIYRSFMQEKA